MVYKSKLQHPGTISHPKRGEIHLCLLDQKTLKELHDEGCAYIYLQPGDPPYEGPIEVQRTPIKKGKASKSKKENTPPPADDSLEKGYEAPE